MSAPLTEDALEALLERAAKRGADDALRRLGLHDEDAAKDLGELRGLLEAFRATKGAAWQAAVKWATTALLVFIAAAVAAKAGFVVLPGPKP